MPGSILGLDIGGANLKAATADKRAAAVPFALWKEPDRLGAVLAELVARFPDADELAVTMTGELCDCFETKRQGVNHILDAAETVANGRPVHVWSTAGEFVSASEARADHMKVAAANWHALATFAGRYAPTHHSFLIDIGSTTTDIIPIQYGVPIPTGLTDTDRLRSGELVYTGAIRTPVCAGIERGVAAELFATTRDVYTVLGYLPEAPTDTDTADGRPATRRYSLARLARMIGGDTETLTEAQIVEFTESVSRNQLNQIIDAFHDVRHDSSTGFEGQLRTIITSGSGEFIARMLLDGWLHTLGQEPPVYPFSLSKELGPELSACAPAFAVATLLDERLP